MRRPAGFTLVELLVVLAILGITAIVTVPAVRSLFRSGGEDAAQRLGVAYRRARDAAAVRATPAAVLVELATASYVVVVERGPSLGADTLDRGVLALDAGVRLEGGRDGWAVATFDAFGRARSDPLAVLDGERRYDVTVDPWTAEIVIRRR